MAARIEAYAHLAGQTLRTGWYAIIHRAMNAAAARMNAGAPAFRPTRPAPPEMELFREVLRLQKRDADNVRAGVYPPPSPDEASIVGHFSALRRMFADLPLSNERRLSGNAEEAASLPEAAGLPDYYARNFHFQTDGYLSAQSAALYDIQVETLFLGSTGAMRRQALKPIADFIRGRDQRQLSLADIACGTGRFLSQIAEAFPALRLTGVDLSAAYVEEARRFLGPRRNLALKQGNAEELPLPDASQDIVTNVYLYHELPREVRRRVTQEIARVLKPGGLFVFVDSLQWGDRPDYDGLLEAFPVRFHEPYYEDYLADDLDALFAECGLAPALNDMAFLSKIMARRKADAA
jgi:ubiquinone/menaquinone biosynthesis C-methylase UbiE